MRKQIDEQRFQMAVMCLALGRAKSAVKADILANGQKVSQFSCREINEKREAFFACHMEELIRRPLPTFGDCLRSRVIARKRNHSQDHSR